MSFLSVAIVCDGTVLDENDVRVPCTNTIGVTTEVDEFSPSLTQRSSFPTTIGTEVGDWTYTAEDGWRCAVCNE